MEAMILRIKNESNMVGISNIINVDVFYFFASKFSTEVRIFDRKNETQKNWINSVNKYFSNEISEMRNILISNIPHKFTHSKMYNDLIEKYTSLSKQQSN